MIRLLKVVMLLVIAFLPFSFSSYNSFVIMDLKNLFNVKDKVEPCSNTVNFPEIVVNHPLGCSCHGRISRNR